LDIAQEHHEKRFFGDLKTAFLNPKSSIYDDRNAIETGGIFPDVPGQILWC